MKPIPPKFPLRLLHLFCDHRFLEEVEGDLEELYEFNLRKFGRSTATRMYWADAMSHFRLYFLRKKSINTLTQNQTAMWTIYLKIASRNFWKNKLISTINIAGLSLGLACFIIIFFHINDELSYDSFLDNGDQIYRVLNYRPGEDTQYDAGGPLPLGPALKEDFAGIDRYVRLWEDYQPTLQVKENVFMEERFVWADEDFFEVISFSLTEGNPATALIQPNSVILTRSMAKKYFGDENPMGKTMEYNGGRGDLNLLVTGLIEDLPHNTHFKFDFLASFNSVKQQTHWGSFKPIWTYVTLKDGVSPDQIKAGFPDFAKKHVSYRVEETPGFGFDLEPMSEIYMHSEADRNMKPLGNLDSLYLLSIIGFSILLIASFNFVNLTLANSLTRLKEVGIRRIAGAQKAQLVNQFLTESILVITLALIGALALVVLALPVYNEVSGKQIAFSNLIDLQVLYYVSLALLITLLVSGLYPAFALANAKGNLVIKRSIDKVSERTGLRNAFVVFQFFVSAILVVGILVIRQQQQYIVNKPLGIDKENVLVVPYSANVKVLIQQLHEMPEVRSVGISQRLPVNIMNYDGRGFEVEGGLTVEAQSCVIDEDFLETYNIELLAGRDHLKESSSQWEFLINESAVAAFGFETKENSLGKKIFFDREEKIVGDVIGVFKDYHLESLHEKIPPMIMFRNISDKWSWWGTDFISIKYQTAELPRFLERIEGHWKNLNQGKAYFSFFIEDSYLDLHEADYRFARLFNFVTFIAILIACLGLLGLSTLIVNQKAKEIGIRKVLGASVLRVIVMLSSRFVRLVLLGLLIATPFAYLLMNKWLGEFSYRITIGAEPFLITFLMIVFVSMLTIVFHTSKAASANPVHVLKDE